MSQVLTPSLRHTNSSMLQPRPCLKPHHAFKLSTSKLSTQQVLNSELYTRLLARIQRMQSTALENEQKHAMTMMYMEDNLRECRADIQQSKLAVWELKNEIMEIEEVLEGELEEARQIEGWLWGQQEGEVDSASEERDEEGQSEGDEGEGESTERLSIDDRTQEQAVEQQ